MMMMMMTMTMTMMIMMMMMGDDLQERNVSIPSRDQSKADESDHADWLRGNLVQYPLVIEQFAMDPRGSGLALERQVIFLRDNFGPSCIKDVMNMWKNQTQR